MAKKSKSKGSKKKTKSSGGTKKGAKGAGAGKPRRFEAAAEPAKPAEPNPYDVFQNRRRRRAVLGERTVRGEKRNLARSRVRAESLRADGLMKEAYSMSRTSRFKDARLGVGDEGTEQRSSVQRLVKLRQKQTRRSFNLKDAATEDLTVGGRPLSGLADEELRAGGGGSDDEDERYGEGRDPNDVVARSKEAKEESARERREHESQLGKLDTDYSDIMGELMFKTPKKLAPLGDKEPSDGYDTLVRTLGMERKAIATDRTKTPEELARERADRLEELERKRRARAEGLGGEEDDDGAAGAEGEEGEESALGRPRRPATGRSAEEGSEAEGESDESGEEESGESDAEEGSEEEGAEEDGAEGEQDEDDEQGEGCPELLGAEEAAKLDITANGKGEDGLPFAPECPRSVRAVETLLGNRAPRTSLKLVQRVRACTASALGADKRAKLRAFFVALLEYAIRVMAREDGDLSARGATVVHALRTPLVELATEHPDEAYEFFASRMRDLGKTKIPKAGDFACLKLIALLFPVTDAQHPLCTPAALLADHWAANIAALGAGIEDLISEGTLLFGIMYDFCLPPRRFCVSFFQLGAAVLESCWASAGAGRRQCLEAAAAIVVLLRRALRELSEAEDATAFVATQELLRPALERLEASKALKVEGDESAAALLQSLRELCAEFARPGLAPLALFETGPAQIKVLDPIFHEAGDRPQRGAEVSESKQLQRRLVKERRAASRQLARDAAVLQQLASQKERQVRIKRTQERNRVSSIMEAEKQELKKMKTESGGGMDTSIKRYTAKKEEKAANKRVGGNNTADSQKGAKEKRPKGENGAKKAKGKAK